VPEYRYLEDFSIGERRTTASVEITEADSLSFARTFDPQPMHIDREAAARGSFGGLIASGWHTAALVMRLIAEARLFGDTEVLGMGVDEIRWPRPVRPGDTIQAEVEVTSVTPSRSRPDFGVVKLKVVARNQHGDVVMTSSPFCWVPRRPPP
jgi:acyl dehydratase